jgi:D-tyrosyl-tRNA(Tyr) deacylase
MRALIQRVLSASVAVDGQTVGQINAGLLVLIGLGKGDTRQTADNMIDKLLAYRLFNDDNGKMGLSLRQTGGGLLLVSQFTLMAETRKGLRPDFGPAMPPTEAALLFEYLLNTAAEKYMNVQSGVFGADMQVSLINDGPVTLMLDVDA